MAFPRCPTLISMVWLTGVAAVHVPAWRRNLAAHPAGCPSQAKPKLLYNHISKTGGSALVWMLRSALGKEGGNWSVQDDTDWYKQITPADKHNYFVLGLVRRPCDFLVSNYYGELQYGGKAQKFDDWVTQRLEHNFAPNQKVNPREDHTWIMSEALELRYGSGDNVHCMVRTHSLKTDFMYCMDQFKACGGTVGDNDTLGVLIDDALEIAAKDAKKKDRSVGKQHSADIDRSACTTLFDEQLQAKVLEKEKSVMDKYALGSCCSSDSKA